MENFSQFFDVLMNSEKLIHYGGLVLLLLVIFMETGLFFGFIFPGDALLFTAGLLCGTRDLNIPLFVLVVSVALAAVVGNMAGFVTGKVLGKRLFTRKDSLFFKQKHLARTRTYYDKYGGISLVGGRFLPVIRTFVPILAGAIDMDFWKFNAFNLAGAILWSATLIPLGYFIGYRFPSSLDHLEYIVLGITLITMTILIRGMIRLKKRSRREEKAE